MLPGVFAPASLRAEDTPTSLSFAGWYGLTAVRAQADYLDAAYQCVLNHISPRNGIPACSSICLTVSVSGFWHHSSNKRCLNGRVSTSLSGATSNTYWFFFSSLTSPGLNFFAIWLPTSEYLDPLPDHHEATVNTLFVIFPFLSTSCVSPVILASTCFTHVSFLSTICRRYVLPPKVNGKNCQLAVLSIGTILKCFLIQGCFEGHFQAIVRKKAAKQRFRIISPQKRVDLNMSSPALFGPVETPKMLGPARLFDYLRCISRTVSKGS